MLYHPACLTIVYNLERALLNTGDERQSKKHVSLRCTYEIKDFRWMLFFPELEVFKKGREVWLASGKVEEPIATTCDHNDALIVLKSANTVRKEMFEHEQEFHSSL